jgi:23S rRNA (cytidine1920-2'-O)/16S rRNA (cytidine1409-2'-O)-methyltransferase
VSCGREARTLSRGICNKRRVLHLTRSAKTDTEPETGRRQRLDQELVARGLVETRAKARDLVLRGLVQVDGLAAVKPAQVVGATTDLTLIRTGPAYVSRGAEKLAGGLAAFGFDPCGRITLDVGSSTGGFTEVLLLGGAAKVYAVDVGRGQLHPRLAADPRVVSLEATDARRLNTARVPDLIDAVTSDVSFISLTKALPASLALARSGAWLIALIKPQFEAGPAHVGRGGIVRDPVVQTRVVDDIRRWLSVDMAWSVHSVVSSPISGGDGNREFLIGATKP